MRKKWTQAKHDLGGEASQTFSPELFSAMVPVLAYSFLSEYSFSLVGTHERKLGDFSWSRSRSDPAI